MAREVHDREDLVRDAVALTPRIKLRRRGKDGAEVFAGFRGPCLSLYFDDDPVFHFNAGGELRRAFVDGRLVKAERRRLAALSRVQSPECSELLREEWEVSRQEEFLRQLEHRLRDLQSALAAAEYQVEAQAPADGDALEQLGRWLSQRAPMRVARSPRVG